jgi:hypothetical protein
MSSATSFILSKTGQRKKTQYTKILSKLVDDKIITSNMLDNAVNGYINKEDLFKNYGLNFVDYFSHTKDNKTLKSFEFFTDEMYKSGIKHKQKYILSELKSAKNKLIDKNTEKLAYDLAESNVSSKAVHNLIGKKIVGLNSSEELNSALRQHLKEVKGGWNVDDILKRTKGLNVEVQTVSDNKIIVEIKDFEASESLGSKSWCVVRNKENYKEYTNEDFRRFFFIYDLDKMPEDELSMIATLVLPSGKISETYDKVDNKISNSNIIDIENKLSPMTEQEIITRIEKGSEYSKNREYIKFGFYEHVRKISTQKQFERSLVDSFRNDLSNIVNAKTVKEFFNIFEKEAYKNENTKIEMLNRITKTELSEWIRECSYSNDYDALEHIMNSKTLKDEFSNDDYTKYAEVDLSKAVTYLLSSKQNGSSEQAIKLIKQLEAYKLFDMNNIISISPMTIDTLDYVEKHIPDYFKSISKSDDFTEKMDSTLDNQYDHQNEDWFAKLFEKMDTSIDKKAGNLLETVNAIFMRIILDGYDNNRPEILMYGLKQYVGAEEFQKIKEENFKIEKTISILFDFQEGFRLFNMVEKLYKFNTVEKLDAERTLKMLSRINLSSNWDRFENSTEEKQKLLLGKSLNKLNEGQLSYQLKFLNKNKDKFDFSKCDNLFKILSNHSGFEDIVKLQDKKIDKKQSLKF